MDTQADEELLNRYLATGEVTHFDELVHRHVGRIRTVIYPMVMNDAETDDLTQEVFIRAFRNAAQFRGGSRFTTWLHRIAVNTALTFLRDRSRRGEDFPGDLPEGADDRSQAPDRAAAGSERDAAIERAMSGLSPELRAAINLVAMQGLSVKEAAKAAGCLAPTMHWRLHVARKRMRESLAGYL